MESVENSSFLLALWNQKTFSPFQIIILILMLIALFIWSYNRIEKPMGRLYRWLGFLGPYFRKGSIKRQLQSQIKEAARRVNDEAGDTVLPSSADIRWVSEETKEAFLKRNQMVIHMKFRANLDKLFIDSFTLFVCKGIVTEAKQYLDQNLTRPIELTMVASILQKSRKPAFLEFRDTILQDSLEDEKIKSTLEKLLTIDAGNLFTRVFLKELEKASYRVKSMANKEEFIKETRAVIDYIYWFAKREIGDTSKPLEYSGGFYSFAFVIVGVGMKLDAQGIEPYAAHISKLFSMNKDAVYIMSSERKENYLDQIEQMINHKYPDRHIDAFKHLFKDSEGKYVEGRCIVAERKDIRNN